MTPPKTERFELRLDQETLAAVDSWRKNQSDLPSRSEAVRRLIETGLGADSRLTYMAMKFQLLTTSLMPGAGELLSDANVFAWQNDVYPFHDQTQEYWAEPFAAHFEVSLEMINELAEYLDGLWLKRKTVTFYELEDRYQVRQGGTNWSRAKLISACRYMFLRGMFDEPFWKEILKRGECPSGSSVMVQEFSRSTEIYLG